MAGPSASQVAAAVADAVRAVPGVVDLDAGPLHIRTTYRPGGRIDGVTVRERTVSVYVTAAWGPVVPVAAAAAEAAERALEPWAGAGPWRVDVEVSDIVAADAAPLAVGKGS